MSYYQKVKGYVLKIFYPFEPLLKEPAPFVLYQKKGLVIFFNNDLQNVRRFRVIRDQRFDVLATKILYIVTYDLN